jgi:hypothetical protein
VKKIFFFTHGSKWISFLPAGSKWNFFNSRRVKKKLPVFEVEVEKEFPLLLLLYYVFQRKAAAVAFDDEEDAEIELISFGEFPNKQLLTSMFLKRKAADAVSKANKAYIGWSCQCEF